MVSVFELPETLVFRIMWPLEAASYWSVRAGYYTMILSVTATVYSTRNCKNERL